MVKFVSPSPRPSMASLVLMADGQRYLTCVRYVGAIEYTLQPVCVLEQFLSEYRKTNTEITLANHSRPKQRNEPIIIRSNYMYPA